MCHFTPPKLRLLNTGALLEWDAEDSKGNGIPLEMDWKLDDLCDDLFTVIITAMH